MAKNIYVSQVATNGYVVGNDANDGLTKATAKLTIDTAITGAAATAAAGDTIVLNDGTYTAVAATFFNLTKSLIFAAENAGQAILKPTAASAPSRVINAGGDLTLGAIVLDGDLTATGGVTFSVAGTLTLNGTVIRNLDATSGVGLNLNSAGGIFVVDGATITCPRQCIITSTALTTGASLTVKNSTLTSTANNVTGGAIFASASTTGARAFIDNNRISHTSSASSVGAIVLRNIRALIQRNAIVNGGGAGQYGVWITTNAAVLAENSCVRWNYIRNNTTSGGMLLCFGVDDASGALGVAGANDIQNNYCSAYGNFLTGNSTAATGLHGLFFGWVKGGCATGNIVVNASIPLITKGVQTERVWFINNVVARMQTSASGALRSKGSTGTEFVGNVVYMESTGETYALQADQNAIPTTPVISTGIDYIANIVRANFTTTKATQVDATSDAEFLFNDYDLAGVSGTPFNYQASTYATLALWSAAQELSAQSAAAGAADKNFWNKVLMPYGALPPSGIMPQWGQ